MLRNNSKEVWVQTKIKEFCSESTIAVILHTNANNTTPCINSGGFFDDVIEFINGTVSLVGTCEAQTESNLA